jgi:hypothetical protein
LRSSCAALLLGIAPVWAHVVSMSTGELRVDGPTAVYELRMPMFEVAHIAHPETALLDHIRFGDAHRTSGTCHEEEGSYACRATYEFSGFVDRLNVECTFFQITVPNHIHILTAVQGPNGDQAVFDQSFPRAEVRFRPPSRFETVTREAALGVFRALASPAGLLFLLGLAIASRTGREAVVLAAMFLVGEWGMRLIAPRIPWPLPPRFIEAAMALSVSYLAVEILMLPDASRRWIIVLGLGLLHGLYFAGFPATYLAGAAAAQVAVIAILAVAARKLPASWRAKPAWALLAAGLGWFAWRLVR